MSSQGGLDEEATKDARGSLEVFADFSRMGENGF